jgi:hypothetical protein
MGTKVFDSRDLIFRSSEKDHRLIANFSAQWLVSDFICSTSDVPFIFEKHLISFDAASPETKQFVESSSFFAQVTQLHAAVLV